MTNSCARILCAFALAALIVPGAASAQSRDARDLSATVERLERQLQTLERTVYRGDAPPAGAGAGAAPPASAMSQFQITQQSLEEQMRRLTGQVEQLEFQVRQMNDRMDRLVADVDFRLRELEGGGGSGGGGAPVAPTTPQQPGSVSTSGGEPGGSQVIGTLSESELRRAGVPSTGTGDIARVPDTGPPANVSLPAADANEQYNYARQFLLRRDFEGAEQAFAQFVAAHPEDPLAGNAQYWLGETHYVRGDYQSAARTFAEGFQRYPDSGKAPDNLLKLGMSLGQLGQTEDACITLKKLRGEYPNAPTSIVQRADREIGRLRCG